MEITIKFNKKEMKLIEEYAKRYEITVEQAIKSACLTEIEDEKSYIESIKEFEKDKTTYTLEEVLNKYGL